MRKLSIRYGKENIEITIAEKNILDVIHPTEVENRDSKAVLTRAIDDPIHNQSLTDFLNTKGPLLCIVNDATRPTKTSMLLDLVGKNVRTDFTQFLVATGAHRAPSEPELRVIFGESHARFQRRIMVHDARDESAMAYFGKTRYGNELWLNNTMKKFEKILVIGSVEPHYFAGFTGGRKSILPGIAGYPTIERNHKFAMHPKAQPLNLEENPLHEEMIDCVRALDDKQLFSVQMVLDRDHNVYDAFTGPIEKTFEMATRSGAQIYRRNITRQAEVVVTIAQWPFDINLYQTLKAIEHGRMALKQSGIMIVVSPCHEGLGPRNFARLFDSVKSIEDAVRNARSSYRLGDHNAVNLASLRKFCEVWTVTRIPAGILKRIGVRQFDSLQHALEQAIAEKGGNTEILFMMDGSLTVPDIS